ncbi:uncharacterized protein LOC107223628 isoform X1 [Neodiprion lecontei]|uniref:Uncharacterized protein LOC107223628 isoform X1 n=1 Tax=Neodiprion lecontei TaxID=441921 RepID=A0ABM3FDA9_NEOLC|nr:uncharacterized protein LOC107223628 isoform X1 [Neodiprion lecontei]
MVKSVATLFLLLVAYITEYFQSLHSGVQGTKIFGIERSSLTSWSDDMGDIKELVENTEVTNQTCIEQSWNIEELSSSIQRNSSASCLTKLKNAVKSEDPDDTALLEVIDKLIEIFDKGSTCASTENAWAYVECYVTIFVSAGKCVLTTWTTEVAADWELLTAGSTIKSLAESCATIIFDTSMTANLKSALQETIECVKKWTT